MESREAFVALNMIEHVGPVRARLLLAGPGRQDLTGEFGLDVTVPGYHSARYAGTARVRQQTRGLVNPISVPTKIGAAMNAYPAIFFLGVKAALRAVSGGRTLDI